MQSRWKAMAQVRRRRPEPLPGSGDDQELVHLVLDAELLDLQAPDFRVVAPGPVLLVPQPCIQFLVPLHEVIDTAQLSLAQRHSGPPFGALIYAPENVLRA